MANLPAYARDHQRSSGLLFGCFNNAKDCPVKKFGIPVEGAVREMKCDRMKHLAVKEV